MLVAKNVHEKLNESIDTVIANKPQYVKNPNRNFVRNRKLSMKSVIKKVLSMSGGSLKKEMHRFSELENIEVTPSAFVQQRSKISSKAFEDIFHCFNDSCTDPKTYRGYRLLAVDGSDINCYRNPDSENYITSSNNPRGYNQIHLNAIYDLCNKTYVEVLLHPRPKEDEQNAVVEMVKHHVFQGKNILIADRGYESYNIFAHLLNTPNLDFACRVRQSGTGLRVVRDLPMRELDIDVNFEVTTTQKNKDKQLGRIYIQTASKNRVKYSPKTNLRRWDFESPYTFKFRIVRFLLDNGEYETIATSLTRKEFSIDEIKELYHMRWGIETSFRELKYAIGLINLHCKKEALIAQELYAALIMYNYCSRIAGNVTVCKRRKAIYAYKVDFTMAIHLCRVFYRENRSNFKKLISDIGKHCEPIRPGRKDSRNIKAKGFVGFTYRVAA